MGETKAPSQVAQAALARYGGQRTVTTLAAAQLLWPVAKWAYERARARENFVITVAGVDDIYPDLHEWVLGHIPAEERRAMIATTHNGATSLRYDGSRKQAITLEGHRVVVGVEREDIPGGREVLSENWRALTEKITFTAYDVAGRDAVVRMLESLVHRRLEQTGPPALYMPSRWGGHWNRRADLPPRTLESVVLRDGQLERLVEDLRSFFAAEERYNAVCQPWHRGYLFYGPPGTGKTSVARALANHFKMPTYYLPLGDLDKDANLMELVGGIEPRSLLLIEDIDVYHAATRRSDQKDKTSVAAMLNALDGVWTPHGLVTIMTTNNRDALDDALIRAGRIDVQEKFKKLNDEQATRIAAMFDADVPPERFHGQSPAAMIEALR